MATGRFMVFEHHHKPLAKDLWHMRFSRDAVADLPFPPEYEDLYGFNAGFTRFMDRGDDPDSELGLFGADRVAYSGAYCFWQHLDPGHHKYVHALRFHFQNHGLSKAALINDQGMRENPFNEAQSESQGLLQYAYETNLPWATMPVDKRYPGAVIELFHFRRGSTGTAERQLLQRFAIPGMDGGTHWYYQGWGRLIAVHDEAGISAKLIISAIHPAYGFRVQDVPTRGADTRN